MSLAPKAYGNVRPGYRGSGYGSIQAHGRHIRSPIYGPAPRPTFIPRPPVGGGVGAGLGAGAGSLAGIIGGLAVPLLCLGCLSTIAILGLFGTMIGAAAYMNGLQKQIRKLATGAGTMVEMDFVILCCALLCSIYVLTKHRRGIAVSS